MNDQEILNLFETTEAIQHGHFILSSGKRSGTYCQCSKLFIDPRVGSKVCDELKTRVNEQITSNIDLIISPALGFAKAGEANPKVNDKIRSSCLIIPTQKSIKL